MDADAGQDPGSSQLFLVRLWADDAIPEGAGGPDGGDSHLHGKVMHVLSGKGSNFNDWPTLLDLLTKMMSPASNHDENATGREGARS
ncbi:MAG: hypothetical protein M3328_15515 [Chloroflexota bacterium]|nr:hypothetical protein [Chloroflexota bacterium]